MALESLPKIAPALFSAEQDLIQIYNKKSDTTGVINASLLGGSTPPSGVSGAIQFSTGSAFGSDSANLFWDDTNNRLGIGTNIPVGVLHLKTAAQNTRLAIDGDTGFNRLISYRTAGLQRFGLYVNNTAESGSNVGSDFAIRAYNDAGTLLNTPVFIKRSTGNVGINTLTGTAKLQVVGSGSTSATTSLLVQNSLGSDALKITDDKKIGIGNTMYQSFTSSLTDVLYSTHSTSTVTNTGIFAPGGSAFGVCVAGVQKAYLATHWQMSGGVIAQGGTGAGLDSSAILEAFSTSKGFLPPRMTNAQRTAIGTPAVGLMVYCTDVVEGLYVYKSTGWTFVI
jgi:hypothetical protein